MWSVDPPSPPLLHCSLAKTLVLLLDVMSGMRELQCGVMCGVCLVCPAEESERQSSELQDPREWSPHTS